MRKEALAAGFYEPEWSAKYPKVQILTIPELLSGKQLEYPRRRVETFNRAKRKYKNPSPTQGLLL